MLNQEVKALESKSVGQLGQVVNKVKNTWEATRKEVVQALGKTFAASMTELEARARVEMAELEAKTKAQIAELETRAKAQIAELEVRTRETGRPMLEALQKGARGAQVSVEDVPEQLRGAWDSVRDQLREGMDAPTREDLAVLAARVDELTRAVERLSRERVATVQKKAVAVKSAQRKTHS